MAAIVMGQLRAPGGTECEIEVVAEVDDICTPCPKRRGQACMVQSKIDRLDRAHSAALGIAPGEVLSWGDALERIKANVRPSDLKKLCKGCSWLKCGMCEAALARLHDRPLQESRSDDTSER